MLKGYRLTREIKKSLLAQIAGKLETELNILRASAAAARDAGADATRIGREVSSGERSRKSGRRECGDGRRRVGE